MILNKYTRIYVDMDSVLCDFLTPYLAQKSKDNPHPQSQARFFENLKEIHGCVDGVNKLREVANVWILTRPSVENPYCYTEKRVWIEEHFDLELCKKLILSPDKGLVKGDFLIDDEINAGQLDFEGTLIRFGSGEFPDWAAVMKYFGFSS